MKTSRLVNDLVGAIGAPNVLAESGLIAKYTTDWLGRESSATCVVATPSTEEQIAAVVDICEDRGVAVVPQGGNTSLVGGATPTTGLSVIMSLTKMNSIESVDASTGHIVTQAGVTLSMIQNRLAGTAWRYGVDFGAREQATVGGMVATNAGGHRVFRLGDTSEQLDGLAYVTAQADIVYSMRALRKDNTGVSLPHLLSGSEGTLGIICKASLRLTPAVESRLVAMLDFDSLAHAIDAAWLLRSQCPSCEAVELMSAPCLRLANRDDASVNGDGSDRWHLLIELVRPASSMVDLYSELSRVLNHIEGLASDVVAPDEPTARALWQIRDAITPSLASVQASLEPTPRAARRRGVTKADVSIPRESVADYVAAMTSRFRRSCPDSRLWIFGHACDDNLHMNVTGTSDPQFELEVLLDGAIEFGGSPSAEHGVGRDKNRWFSQHRSVEELSQMGAIKNALDPSGIFNPGVLVPLAALGEDAL